MGPASSWEDNAQRSSFNLAIYDQAIGALGCTGTVPLLRAKDIAGVLDDFKVALV